MTDEKTGVEDAAAAGQQDTGVNDANAADSQTSEPQDDQGKGVTEAAAVAPDEQGKLEALKAEREKRQQAEQQLLQYQAALMQQQQTQAQPQQQQQQGLFGDVQDDDYIDGKRYKDDMTKLAQGIMAHVQNQLAEQQFKGKHPDYDQVIGGPNALAGGQFLPAQPLQQYIAKNPSQAMTMQSLLQTPQGQEIAYKLVTSDPEYQNQKLMESPKTQQEAQAVAQKMINNANMASVSNAGSSSSMDRTSHMKNMSKEDFQKYKDSIIARGG